MTPSELLDYFALVELEQPAFGWWDGGAKSRFGFTPSLELTPGPPAIRWGSYAANLWLVIPVGKTKAAHFAALRRKLRGKAPRRVTISRENL